MKKRATSSSADKNLIFCKKRLFLIMPIILILINFVYAEIRINEVELNPAGSDGGKEWIELYSDSLINLEGWKLVNHDNKVLFLNQSFNGYLIINFEEQWLDNENESIILYNGNSLVSITPVLKDSSNDNKAWNYCNGVLRFLISSSGLSNNCQTQSNNTNSNSTNNTPNSTDQTNPANNSSNSEIFLILDWDENDIINGESFEITIKAYNLLDKEYDIKTGIYDEDNKLISQTYDENEKWVSSSEYYNKFFRGPGSAEEDIKLRVKESYRHFKGDVKIIARIRETGSSVYKKEKQEDIEILKSKVDEENYQVTAIEDDSERISQQKETKIVESENIIYLAKNKNIKSESIKTSKNTIYQSKNEIIKAYSIYFFAFLLIILCVLLVFVKI